MDRRAFSDIRHKDLQCTVSDYQTIVRVFHDRAIDDKEVLQSCRMIVNGAASFNKQCNQLGVCVRESRRSKAYERATTKELLSQVTVYENSFDSLLLKIKSRSRLVRCSVSASIEVDLLINSVKLENILGLIVLDLTTGNGRLMGNMVVSASETALESKVMRKVAQVTQKDSSSMKVAALISLAYLPANFLAVCRTHICLGLCL